MDTQWGHLLFFLKGNFPGPALEQATTYELNTFTDNSYFDINLPKFMIAGIATETATRLYFKP